jgi:hypothetical protein
LIVHYRWNLIFHFKHNEISLKFYFHATNQKWTQVHDNAP